MARAAACAAARAARAVAESVERRVLLAADPVISEFLGLNDNGITDADGDHSDWIEIHNRGDEPANMAGWHLTDGPGDKEKWTFPPVTVPAGGYVLVWASDKHPRSPNGQLHINFKLDGDGEYLALLRPNLSVATEFAPQFPRQQPDVSYGVGAPSSSAVGLLASHGPVRVRVPSDGSLGTNWTARTGFTDSGWTPGSTGVGFDAGATGPTLPNEFEPNGAAGSANDASTNFAPHDAGRYHLSIRGNVGTSDARVLVAGVGPRPTEVRRGCREGQAVRRVAAASRYRTTPPHSLPFAAAQICA